MAKAARLRRKLACAKTTRKESEWTALQLTEEYADEAFLPGLVTAICCTLLHVRRAEEVVRNCSRFVDPSRLLDTWKAGKSANQIYYTPEALVASHGACTCLRCVASPPPHGSLDKFSRKLSIYNPGSWTSQLSLLSSVVHTGKKASTVFILKNKVQRRSCRFAFGDDQRRLALYSHNFGTQVADRYHISTHTYPQFDE